MSMNTTSTTEQNLEVANTILAQMGGGARRMRAMLGPLNLGLVNNGVRVAFKNPCRKANMVEVVLDLDDTYTVRFFKKSKLSATLVSEVNMAYCDQLQDLFEKATGLYLPL